MKQVPLLIAGAGVLSAAPGPQSGNPLSSEIIAQSAAGKLRGVDIGGSKVFKDISYGASTASVPGVGGRVPVDALWRAEIAECRP